MTALTVVAIACGGGSNDLETLLEASDRQPAAESAITPTRDGPGATPPANPDGDADQPFSAAPVELDTEAFAEINPGGPRDVDPRRFRQLLARDRIVPIYEPLVVSPDEVILGHDDLVMGVAINGEARAYPIGMMRSREIANDELGGVPLLVTW